MDDKLQKALAEVAAMEEQSRKHRETVTEIEVAADVSDADRAMLREQYPNARIVEMPA